MSTPTRIHIEQLTFEGYTEREAHLIRRALEAELRDRMQGGADAGAGLAPGHRADLDAGRIAPGRTPAQVGRELAARVHRHINHDQP